MTPEELAAIEARMKAATPGWRLSKSERGSYIVVDKETEETEDGHTWTERWEEGIFTVDYNATDADAAFIAHAPRDVARLLAEVERLRGENGTLRACTVADDYHETLALERDAALDLLNDALDFAESYLRGDDDHSIEWLKDWARRAQAAVEARNA